jgi:hypothetical protein
MRYRDTSALAKLYVAESDSPQFSTNCAVAIGLAVYP